MKPNVPIQPVDKPIICSPCDEPNDHWFYDTHTGQASRAAKRRPASYWYKTERTGSAQGELFAEEERDDLPLVNLLREDVRRWRDAGYRGASNVTKELLRWWANPKRGRRLFFCQREAVETVIYLTELRSPGKSSRTGFKKFDLSDDNLALLLKGERPQFENLVNPNFWPTLPPCWENRWRGLPDDAAGHADDEESHQPCGAALRLGSTGGARVGDLRSGQMLRPQRPSRPRDPLRVLGD